MQTPTNQSYDAWVGHDAYDNQGEKIGEITDIFYDDRTGRPEWITVKAGMFKGNTFVPIHGSQVVRDPDGADDNLRLSFSKDMIKDAPRVDADSEHLTPTEEQELWSYYGYDYNADPKLKTHGYGTDYTKNRADRDFQFNRFDREQNQWRDMGEEEAVTIRNQEAQVVDQPETVRLRKYQRTEMVPVTKEEVRVERSTDMPDSVIEDERRRSRQTQTR
jgi:PRC-barrel domain